MSICNKCGENIKDENKYCTNCGTPASNYYERTSNPVLINNQVNPEIKSAASVSTRIIIDEPDEDDAQDFKNYSEKLSQIIINSTPRFTIGIFGGWGTGKTTLMRVIKESSNITGQALENLKFR